MTDLTPTPDDRFAFGLWTVGHDGHDPFGTATRAPITPAEIVRRLADLGVWGVNFHDDDLFPPDATPAERQQAIDDFRRALDDTGVVVCTATTNLFTHPVFKEGALVANDRSVRRYALQKVMRNLDLAAELGASTYVMWGGREGVDSLAAKDPVVAIQRYREALDFLCGYVRDRGYDLRFALEPKPNEPRGDTFLPTVGHCLAFIEALADPEIVGVNPEVAHETMAGLSFAHAVAQALEAGKLFHIDLNAQKIGRYDQDYRFGAEGIKDTFFTVKVLEEGGYDGPRHFDARPYRTDRDESIWDFAMGCMRTYKAFAEKVRQFNADPGIAEALDLAGAPELAVETVGAYSAEAAEQLRGEHVDLEKLAARSYHNDLLDQRLIELLLGVR